MNWDQIQASWKQLKEKLVFQWSKAPDDSDKGLETIGAEVSSGGQSNVQPTAFHPDDRGKRTEFSLHIGCWIAARGYKEEGKIATVFDMRVQNDIDRFHIMQDVVDKLRRLGSKGAYLKQAMRDKLIDHKHYIGEHGEELPEIRDWKWGAPQ